MKKEEFFDGHAPDWDRAAPAGMEPRLARVVAEAHLRPGQRVLDVGSGTGVLIPHILRAVGEGGWVAALDLSAEMLAIARGKCFPANVGFLQADIQQVPLADQSFDRVICNAAFPHFADERKALAEMIRVLRPSGLLVISHPIGREAVNALHRDAGEAVAGDRVLPGAEMRRLLKAAGLKRIRVIDEPQFYLASARKAGAGTAARGNPGRA